MRTLIEPKKKKKRKQGNLCLSLSLLELKHPSSALGCRCSCLPGSDPDPRVWPMVLWTQTPMPFWFSSLQKAVWNFSVSITAWSNFYNKSPCIYIHIFIAPISISSILLFLYPWPIVKIFLYKTYKLSLSLADKLTGAQTPSRCLPPCAMPARSPNSTSDCQSIWRENRKGPTISEEYMPDN